MTVSPYSIFPRNFRTAILVFIIWSAVGLRFCTADDDFTQPSADSKIDLEDLRRHVSTLASDSLEGREAGSRGGKASIAYLRSVLKSIRQTTGLPQEQTQEFGREYQNLLVLLPGSDERLKHEVIVVGAHYDHVGFGRSNNSQGPIGYIHNGADDNASGTAAVLELIEAFSSTPDRPARSILFAFWDAEEIGLLGSKHWVAQPTVLLQDLRFVLNLDMLGRLRNGRVITVGWRSAAGLRPFLATHNSGHELLLAFQPKVIADSDHYPFYAAGIPTVHLDTDKHDDYHRPTDDPERINWQGLKQITEFAYRLVQDAANRADFPRFRREALSEPAPDWVTQRELLAPPIRLGASWDPRGVQQNKIVVAGVNPGSAAARAGLQIGDRVRRFGPWKDGTFDDFKTAVQVSRNPVAIQVERPGQAEPMEFVVNLPGNPVRLGAGWRDDPAVPNCLVITQVIADSPAARAGMAAGDVIIDLGGRSFTSSEDLRQRILSEPGPFHFRIERLGQIRDLTVDLMDEPPHETASREPR